MSRRGQLVDVIQDQLIHDAQAVAHIGPNLHLKLVSGIGRDGLDGAIWCGHRSSGGWSDAVQGVDIVGCPGTA